MLMGIELMLTPEQISGEELVRIYKLFCCAYDVQPDKNDVRYLNGLGVEALQSFNGLDLRPNSIGGKFIGERDGSSTRFWCNLKFPDPDEKRKDERFLALAVDYYGQNMVRHVTTC